MEETDKSPEQVPDGEKPVGGASPNVATGAETAAGTETAEELPLVKPDPPHGSAGVLGFLILVVAVLMIAGSIVAEVHYGRIAYRQVAAMHWPTAEARILSVQDGWSIRGGRWSYVTYTYEVGDQAFRGSTRDLPRYSNAELRVASAAGHTLPVHYQPEHPDVSVLDPGLTWKRTLFFIPLLAVTFVGFMILVMAVMARFRPERFDLALAALPDDPGHRPAGD